MVVAASYDLRHNPAAPRANTGCATQREANRLQFLNELNGYAQDVAVQ